MSSKLQLNTRLNDFWIFPKLSTQYDLRRYDDQFFSFLDCPGSSKRMTQLYIHVPFCDSGCLYCPYYKVLGEKNYSTYASTYVDSLVKEMEYYARTPYFDSLKISSVHFGGGNPFLLELDRFRYIVHSIHRLFDTSQCKSWTSEGSIHSLNSIDYVRGLKDMGIDRFSFGIQTFKKQIRKKLNIRPTISEIFTGVDVLNKVGVRDYCIDMMYDLPEQSIEDMTQDLDRAANLDPYHIDCYNMWVFPNTRLKRLIEEKQYFDTSPSNENNIKMYNAAVQWFQEHKFYQSTSCTFSKTDSELHVDDSIYLSNANVFALGPSSRGYLDGYSYRNVCSIVEYSNQLNKGNFPADLAYLSPQIEREDRTMIFFPITLRIRAEHIPNFDRYRQKIDHLVEADLLKWDGDILRVTEKGLVWTGNISAYFIGEKRWNIYIQSILGSIREGTNPYNEDYMGTESCRDGKI